MNKVFIFSTLNNLSSTNKKIKWGQKNLPEDVFDIIKKSYNKILKKTLLLLICIVIPILIFSVSIMMGGNNDNIADKPQNAVAMRTARVGYDKNLYWTYEKKAYEIDLAECNLDTNLETGKTFYIYVDNSGQLIEVLQNDPYKKTDMRIYISIALFIVATIITVSFAILIRKFKFAQPWYLFVNEYDGDGNWDQFCENIRTL